MKEVWLAVDEDGSEVWYSDCPVRYNSEWLLFGNSGLLFPGAIKFLTGKELTWNDEPIKIEL